MEKTLPEKFSFIVRPEYGGRRLDLFLVEHLKQQNLTRSRIKALVDEGLVLVCGQRKKAGYLLRGLDEVEVLLPGPVRTELVAEDIDFILLYEDEDILVLSKPPGIVVHPACGHETGTLVHGLLYRCDNLSGINGEVRPGIVHRLDKDTSGIMVVAKNDRAHNALARQFKDKQVEKFYYAIVDGIMRQSSGLVDLPIGRHPVHRKKMAVRDQGGRTALTHWRLLQCFGSGHSFIELRLETGRTHQIRVHMAHHGHPVAGDTLYGGRRGGNTRFNITRQCLHSSTLSFVHPRSGKRMRFTAPLWPDMAESLALLRKEEGLDALRDPCDR